MRSTIAACQRETVPVFFIFFSGVATKLTLEGKMMGYIMLEIEKRKLRNGVRS